MSIAINNVNNPRFNIVEYIKKLRNAGVSQEVAEIQGQEIELILEVAINNSKEELQAAQRSIKANIESKDLVTKNDLEITKLELQKEIEIVRKEIAQSSNKVIIWVAGLLGTFGIFFLGILAKGFHWM